MAVVEFNRKTTTSCTGSTEHAGVKNVYIVATLRVVH